MKAKSTKSRGADGEQSMVMSVKEDIVATLNSSYQIEGDMEHLTLPWSSLPVLQQGAPPEALKALQEKGYRHVGGDEP